jgi:hypothetical protein
MSYLNLLEKNTLTIIFEGFLKPREMKDLWEYYRSTAIIFRNSGIKNKMDSTDIIPYDLITLHCVHNTNVLYRNQPIFTIDNKECEEIIVGDPAISSRFVRDMYGLKNILKLQINVKIPEYCILDETRRFFEAMYYDVKYIK